MIKEFSLKIDGNINITKNFKVSEFACHDGSDKMLANINLFTKVLQPMRDWIGGWIRILSGYRTKEYNLKINNSTTSQHCYGNAADIYRGYTKEEQLNWACLMALWAFFNGACGVGLYINRQNGDNDGVWAYVHVDFGGRTNNYYWINDNGQQYAVIDMLDEVIKIKTQLSHN